MVGSAWDPEKSCEHPQKKRPGIRQSISEDWKAAEIVVRGGKKSHRPLNGAVSGHLFYLERTGEDHSIGFPV